MKKITILFMGVLFLLTYKGDAALYAEQNTAWMPMANSIVSVDKSTPTQKFLVETKESNLPVILLGTIVESKPADSLAVIKETTSQKQRVCKVGEQILSYQIVKILRAQVVLLKEGKISLLDFPLGGDLEPIVAVSSDERIINRSALAKKIPDLNTAIQQAIPIPYIESGKIAGFKITKLKDKALAKMAGIKEGDVVMSVNGDRLNSLRDTLDIYSRVKNEEKINLEIKRGDKVQNLVYHIL